ncbi:MAG: endonuclease [Rhodobacterales bacterium]|nr:MAG: endonuclease [Rhodobacterales bacterium]
MLLAALAPSATLADAVRVATYSAAFSRDGPGLLLRDLLKGDAQTDGAIDVIAHATPDILLLTEFDYDAGGAALSALIDRLADKGLHYPHHLALRPNTGRVSGLDLNENGRLGDAEDAQGFGRFAGDGGMAILSRFPIREPRDLSSLLWRDLPGSRAPEVLTPDALAAQRLSSTAHWVVPVETPGTILTLLCFAATAPIFDGPEDRSGARNADEIMLWLRLFDGALGDAPNPPFVVLGRANLDPQDGEGRHGVIRVLLSDPRLQDPAPSSGGARAAADPDHDGDPAHDTADWPRGAPGNLRVSYVLPSADVDVMDAQVVWPRPGSPLDHSIESAGPHRLVWIDITIPRHQNR